MRAIRCLLAAVLAAGIVTVVAAQPGRQPGGAGGGGTDPVVLVLTNKVLQEEVKITDAQKEEFKTIAEKQTEMFKKAGEGFKDKFSDAKGDKDKFREIMADFGKEMGKVSTEVKKLTEEKLTSDQKKRLHQIAVQLMGINAFADPESKTGGGMGGMGGFNDGQKAVIKEVGAGLKLTDAQKTKIKGLLEEYNKDRDSIRKDIFGDTKGGKGFDQEKMKDFRTKTAKLSAEVMDKIAESLDDTQKTAWKGMVGEPFDTSKLFAPPPKKD